MVNEGTYEIHSVVAPDKVIDCYNAADTSGANVQVYDRNRTDAQYVYKMDNPDGSCRLAFVLTGKSIDIENGSVTAGTNVQQWSDNGSNAQKWMLVPDGKSVQYDGQSYETYFIKAAADQTLAITTAGSTSESNVSIQKAGKSETQRWFFVEQNTVPDGVYFIRSAMDEQAVLDVSGGSHANGAKVQLWGHNFTNAQAWIVKNVKAEKGLQLIRNAESGKFLAVVGSQNKDFAKIWQWDNDGSPGLRWYAEAYGSMQINGASVPTYILHYYGSSGTTRVMDAMAAQKNPGTELVIYPMHRAKNQQWAFQPASFYDSELPTPALIRCSKSKTGGEVTSLIANHLEKIYLSWVCSGTEFQARYRTRERKPNGAIGAWSPWKSVYDGSHANDGFGNLGMPNCITENTRRKYAPSAINVPVLDNSKVDYAEIEVQAQRWAEVDRFGMRLKAHGSGAGQVMKLVWKPDFKISAVEWSPFGLDVHYESDYRRDGNSIVLSSIEVDGRKLCEGKTFSGLSYFGEIRIPLSELNFIPEEGQTIKVSAMIRTDAGVYSSATASVPILYNINQGIDVQTEHSVDFDRLVFDVKFKNTNTENRVYILYDGKLIECQNREDVFEALPPLNKAYTVFMTSVSGDRWGVETSKEAPMTFSGYVWNWNGKCAVLRYGADDPISYSNDRAIDVSDHVTTGRSRPVYRFGKTVERSANISGAYTDIVKNGDRKAMEALAGAGRATFRTPRGEIFEVAVLSVKTTHKGVWNRFGEWGTVAVEQKEGSYD